MKIRYFVSTLFVVLLFSCEKEEEPFTPKQEEEEPSTDTVSTNTPVIVDQVNLDSDYKYHSFYDLESGKELSKSLRSSWDVRLSDEGVLYCNTFLGVRAAKTAILLDEIKDTVGLDFSYDRSSLNPNEVAMQSDQFNYAIDRGPRVSDRLWKIAYVSTSQGINIQIKRIDNSTEKNYLLKKGDALSFDSGILTIFPKDNAWDFAIGQYITELESTDGPISYSVVGILTNPTKWSAAELENTDFDSFTLELAQQLSYSSSADIIGHDWKTYLFSPGLFETHIEKLFILKSTSGTYYKLHFLDFYGTTGQKGSPKFEFQKL